MAAAALTDRSGRFVVHWRAVENGTFSVAAVGVAHTGRAVTLRLRPRVDVTRAVGRARSGESILIRGAVRPAFAGSFLGFAYLQVYQRPSGGLAHPGQRAHRRRRRLRPPLRGARAAAVARWRCG